MSPQEVLSQLLAADGGDWFLVVTQTGRAEISTHPEGHVVGKIQCHQLEKNSNDDSTITALTDPAVTSSPGREPLVSNSH